MTLILKLATNLRRNHKKTQRSNLITCDIKTKKKTANCSLLM